MCYNRDFFISLSFFLLVDIKIQPHYVCYVIHYPKLMSIQKKNRELFALSSRSWITCHTNKKARGVPRASSLSSCLAMF